MHKKTDLLQIRKVMGVLHCILSLGVYEKVICGKVHNIIKLSKQIGIQAGIQGGKNAHIKIRLKDVLVWHLCSVPQGSMK